MEKTLMIAGLLSSTLLATAQNSPYIKAVDEYVPAPGQFVNTMPALTENDTPETAAQKCTEAVAGKKQGELITLGAYGGYITFHFDHPLVNVEGDNDFKIYGNAFPGNSEPGIVMVSQDLNENGLPDDEWYELSGSADEDSIGKVVYDYEITYTKNSEPVTAVKWTDNKGNSGEIPRIEPWHPQEYYPLWITEKQLTFKGTRLPNNSYKDPQTGWFKQNAFRYGYADNLDNENSFFNIENAVDKDRKKVKLRSVNFVRVYCAMNQVVGNSVGETSTEFAGAEDLHPNATAVENISAEQTNRIIKSIYTIDGREIKQLQRGVNIVRYSNGETKKIIVK